MSSHQYKEYIANVEDLSIQILLSTPTRPPSLEAFTKAKILHTHSYAEIFTCSRGSLTVTLEDEVCTLSAGEFLIIPASLPHLSSMPMNRGDCNSIGVFIQKRSAPCFNNIYRSVASLCYSTSTSVFRDRPEVAAEILRLSRMREDTNPTVLCLELLSILLSLTEDNSRASDETAPIPTAQIKRTAALEAIITLDYTTQVTLEDVAKKLYISPRQLERLVKKRYGTTFHQAIVNRRLDAAEKLLTETDLQIGVICRAVGMPSSTSFYNAFKRRHGMTPQEYRTAKKDK